MEDNKKSHKWIWVILIIVGLVWFANRDSGKPTGDKPWIKEETSQITRAIWCPKTDCNNGHLYTMEVLNEGRAYARDGYIFELEFDDGGQVEVLVNCAKDSTGKFCTGFTEDGERWRFEQI